MAPLDLMPMARGFLRRQMGGGLGGGLKFCGYLGVFKS